MRGPSPLYIEERHRALGRDATFSWSRALTHPPRCNRTRHRGRHLDFVGAAILVSWGPPSWTGSDVIGAIVGPILLAYLKNYFPYFSTKPYVVGAHNNRVIETVLLSTQTTCLNGMLSM